MMGSGCDCPTCERAKSEQPMLAVAERHLMAGVERLQQEQEREVLGRLDIPGVDPEQIVFDLDEWADRYGDALKDVLLGMLGAGWCRGSRVLRSAVERALGKALKSEAIAGWDVFDVNVQTWAQTYPREFGERVNRSWAKRITRTVADGLEASESLPDLRKRLEATLFNGVARRYRAETIARTESVRARAGGQVQAWKNSGVVSGKVWATTPGVEWPCAWCQAMEGKHTELDGAYFNQGGSLEVEGAGTMKFDYEVVEHPPLHPRCRCDEVPDLMELDPLSDAIARITGE